MRTFVIGDIHGGLLALEQVMKKANVNEKDTLLFLGDYVDGWSHSPQVIDFLIDLKNKQNCICIRGNHDELALDWLEDRIENIDEKMWFKHGGQATVEAYSKVSKEKIATHIEFLKSLQDYHLDSQNRLFVHAGFTNVNGVEYEYFPKMFYWDRTLWEMALSLDQNLSIDDLFYPKRLSLYKEIFIGHTPVTRIGQTVPVQKACVWNVDTGAAFKGPLTIMDVDTKQFWQSEPLNELYFDEKGRN
ncbi:metallophosphoesterase family protein [Flavobacterium sp. Fl-77]|uniref:Metallophosphoesterase family protein n=1 Tax=Flavobacterium flavipigmentatum TaxID=2893884 RepID=A0AAJ2SD91_9FLAO|nr:MULTISPECIES: metallophosphoesterase family protein [unclassified Flavobacterium]MDX6181144.1 metallophosphoesterase family protein [Flavobacterium sp. Fl-33]MDX6184745.1 metallophosphoesterase family protein [Flavobacterium sp. Fl-77]UFH39843.1 serine/threonine protein phosphatase [Flavobacterium sp. F-70]